MRRVTIALSAVTLSVALGACSQGSSGSPESNEQNAQGGAPFADVASLSSGANNSAKEKQSVTFTIEIAGSPALSQAGNMECQADIAKSAMSCANGQMELVATSEATYLKRPQAPGSSEKPWQKLPSNGRSPLTQSTGTQGLQKMTDFKAMLPAGTKIVNNTPEQVNGTDATRYETVTDLEKASSSADPQLKPLYRMLTDAGVTKMKQSVWVDSEGLPLRAKTTQPPFKVKGQPVPEITTTITYKDWGKPVRVDVPSPDQVQDMKVPQVPNVVPQPPN